MLAVSYDRLQQDGEALEETDSTSTHERLRRSLTMYDGIGVSVGIMIGSGIFASPGVTLERCGSPAAALLAWVAAALLVACAGLCYAELVTSIPDAGGDFAYLQRAYGGAVSFSFAWCNFWVGKTGSQAIITTVSAHYFVSAIFGSEFLSSDDGWLVAKLTSVALVILLCAINCAGVKESSSVINVLTAVKLLLVLSLFVSAIAYVIFIDNSTMKANLSLSHSFLGSNTSGFLMGMIPALWAFDGWADLNFMAEEMVNPQRRLPQVIGISVLLVAVAYICANVAYLSALDASLIKGSHSVAMDFGRAISGRWFSVLLSVGVAISAAGSANGSVMTGGRAFFAVARAGRAPKVVSRLNSAGSPWVALVAQAAWSIVLLCLPGSSFSSLLDYFGPASWVFYALTGFGVIIIRYKEPNLVRPCKVPLYPLPPIVLCAVSIFLVGNAVLASPFFTFLAFGFIALSFPVYYIFLYNLDYGEGSHQSWWNVLERTAVRNATSWGEKPPFASVRGEEGEQEDISSGCCTSDSDAFTVYIPGPMCSTRSDDSNAGDEIEMSEQKIP